ncbi:hypothetical protein FZC71_00895 [Bacillus subtilis]|nr:hypothetical protein FZC71_00895 [Bacillus subtilis]
MKKVKSIDLVLENCEVLKFDSKYIGRFYMTNITRTISRKASNLIGENYSAENVFLQLFAEGNDSNAFKQTWPSNSELPFDRLQQCPDIVAIDVFYEDSSNDYILVNWSGDSDVNNENQTAKLNEYTGDLFLVISGKETVENYFEDVLAEDESYYGLFD